MFGEHKEKRGANICMARYHRNVGFFYEIKRNFQEFTIKFSIFLEAL